MRQIIHRHANVLNILPHNHRRRLREDLIDLLETLPLGLGHEEKLPEPAHGGNTAVEAQGQADTGHGLHHAGEVIGHDERAEEQVRVGGGHAVASQVGREDLGGNDPGETGVGAEEAHVEDDSGQVGAFGGGGVGLEVDLVADADEHQAEEEARQRDGGPDAAAESLHVQHGGDGADEQGAAADERHEDGGALVEADFVHEHAHVVHDGVDAGELAEEDDDVGVDHGAAGAAVGEEVHPGVLLGVLLFMVFGGDGLSHAEELVLCFERGEAADAFPDAVGFGGFAFVHEEARAFGEE